MRKDSHMRFQVTLDRDEEGMWIVECPAFAGCVSQGDTRQEAITNIKDAIKEYLEVCAEQEMSLSLEIE